VVRRGQQASVLVHRLGTTGGDTIALPGERPVLVKALTERFEGWLPTYMAGGPV
jgi:phosphoribosylformylglycinamidine synthase